MGNRYLRARKDRNSFTVMLVIIVLIVIMAVVSYDAHHYRELTSENNKVLTELQSKIDAEELRTAEIAEHAKYTKTKKYAEEVAKEKLGLVNKNEIVFMTDN